MLDVMRAGAWPNLYIRVARSLNELGASDCPSSVHTLQSLPIIHNMRQVTRTGGEQHLVWSDQWRAALDACAAQPTPVRAAVFKRMIAHGWSVLADPIRLRGPHRAEFFRRFSALYCERRGPGLPRNAFLASRSWTLGRLRLLPRQARARLPHGVLLVRDRIRSATIALRRKSQRS